MSEQIDRTAPPPPREPNITLLELNFPHGVNSGECQRIAMFAEKICQARVSEGGYKPSGLYGLMADPITFSPNQYYFTFGYPG